MIGKTHLDHWEILPVMGDLWPRAEGQGGSGVQGGGGVGRRGAGRRGCRGVGKTSVRIAEPPASGFIARTKQESLWKHSLHC